MPPRSPNVSHREAIAGAMHECRSSRRHCFRRIESANSVGIGEDVTGQGHGEESYEPR
jgi:hypothetical protein